MADVWDLLSTFLDIIINKLLLGAFIDTIIDLSPFGSNFHFELYFTLALFMGVIIAQQKLYTQDGRDQFKDRMLRR